MRRFLFIFSIFTTIICGRVAHAADTTPACVTAIGNDTEAFVNVLKSEILKGKEFDQKLVDKEKTKLYNLVAANIMTHCFDVTKLDDFNSDIVDASDLSIPFKMDDKYYKLNVNVSNLFDHIDLLTGVMVTNLRQKGIGDVITKAETPSDYFFSGSCSDHWVRVNIDNDVPVNKAGQLAFTTYSGKEFFIDFPFGKSNRAFPGLIIASTKGLGGSEQVVTFSNYKKAREAAKAFADALQNTACTNDRLVVDVVSLSTVPVTQNGKTSWAIGGGVAGGAAVGLGIALASNPVGWIIAGVAAVGSAVAYTIAPQSLADLQQVMIMDGPHMIR